MSEFVELQMNRGVELFNVEGILRVAPSKSKARIYLFGLPQPVETEESYDAVRLKVLGVIKK